MSDHYAIYRDMLDESKDLEEEIRTALEKLDVTIYTVYVSVGDENTRQFFADIEYGGSPEKYRRYRGLYTKAQLERKFLKEV